MRKPQWRKAFWAFVLAGASVNAMALDNPKPSSKDWRIRTTQYDPSDVIAIPTVTGIATHIELSDDEQFVWSGFGDPDAYHFEQTGKHLIIKPAAPQANTNLIVITDKRSYSFLLQHQPAGAGKDVVRLTLGYPDIDTTRAAQLNESRQLEQALAHPGLAINWTGYTMSGDHSLAPLNAWDDGAQTWLRFAPGQDLPAVYFVDADGNEVIVNRHMEDAQTMVLHRVAAKWHVRLGDQVLAIYNENPSQTRGLPTGTVSPQVKRVLRKESQ
ncbi:type IV secretion system protein VirB9 [Pusillimonas caeni]|uniref:TrbG/VirB9 family P-type conjugative transfer protein n=1 Tax=Pusillimonas caeni TaxID=1348472 RepID=UPI000E59D9D4|nr:TrbG/VirB9 family P-type conjugative transfer protein [Pusillimonas caeni]TFL14068.1 type IV secretion system protein VirB9 [Pusillimonas caeni]